MADPKAPYPAAGVGRLGTIAAWISAVCCLPYLLLKVVWTLGIPVGISDRSVLDSSGWVAGNALMAGIELAGLLLVLALVWPRARRLPAWLLLFPVWVGTGLLFEVVVGAALMGLFSPAAEASGESTDLGGFQPWVFVLVYSSFAGQGVALAIAFACHVRARWGWLLGHHGDDSRNAAAKGHQHAAKQFTRRTSVRPHQTLSSRHGGRPVVGQPRQFTVDLLVFMREPGDPLTS